MTTLNTIVLELINSSAVNHCGMKYVMLIADIDCRGGLSLVIRSAHDDVILTLSNLVLGK